VCRAGVCGSDEGRNGLSRRGRGWCRDRFSVEGQDLGDEGDEDGVSLLGLLACLVSTD
jgi:hypothetical protein